MSDWIFISHSSKDKGLAQVICEYLSDSGLPDQDFFCSSYGTPIGVGENDLDAIYDYMDRTRVIIELISKSFFESERCLMEVGYAMARERYANRHPGSFPSIRFFPLVVPPVSYGRVNDRLHRRQAIMLDSSAQCRTFAAQLYGALDKLGADVDENRWRNHESQFSKRCVETVEEMRLQSQRKPRK
ncbi:toll/interleukin-1 receptor domain-containing protein [Streptomyces sp. NPDC056660]|uniref:toll/interleukin-1 receptor domain-containing protein n=1 Tax=Streptomyces sp. NPDC056660 TaxID=3345897 RepID=UPI003685ED75